MAAHQPALRPEGPNRDRADPAANPAETSFSLGLVRAGRYYFRGRRGWLALGGVAVAAGLAFNWGWLVTAGDRPDPDQRPALRRDVRCRRLLHEKNGRSVLPGSRD